MNEKQFISTITGFITIAIKLNNKRLENGLGSLEIEVEDLDDEYFRKGLRFIIDGVDSKIIDEIFSNYLSFEKDSYKNICMNMVKRTVLGIQEGLSNRDLFFILCSMTGLPLKEEEKVKSDLRKLLT